MAIGVPLAAIAKFIDGNVVPNAGNDVLQNATAWLVEEHVVGDHGWHASLSCQIREVKQPKLVIWSAPQRQRHIGAIAEALPHAPKPQSAKIISDVRNEDGDQPVAIKRNVIPFDLALALASSLLAKRQQTAQSAVGGAVGG